VYLKKNLSTLYLLLYSEYRGRKILRNTDIYEGWNFNIGNYLFTTETK